MTDQKVQETLSELELNEKERTYARQRISQLKEDWQTQKQSEVQSLNLRLDQLRERLTRLTDAFIDGTIEKDLFEEHKITILLQRKTMEETLTGLRDGTVSIPRQLAEFLELAGSAYLNYKMGIPEEKRDLLKIVTSNCEVEGKSLCITLAIPFSEVANRFQNSSGVPERDIARTWDPLIDKLWNYFKAKLAGENPDVRL